MTAKQQVAAAEQPIVTLADGRRYRPCQSNWRYAAEWLSPAAAWTAQAEQPPVRTHDTAAVAELPQPLSPQQITTARAANQAHKQARKRTAKPETGPRRPTHSEAAAILDANAATVVCHPETNTLTLAECQRCGTVRQLDADGRMPPHNAIGGIKCPGDATEYSPARPAAIRLQEAHAANVAKREAEAAAAPRPLSKKEWLSMQPKPKRKPRNEWHQVQAVEA